MSSNELLLSDNSKACYLPTKSLNGWYDPYLPSSIHYNHKSKERIGTIASKGVMTSQYEHLSCAGDNTVAAGSGEAPYMAKVKGGYFMHGTAYAHKELRDKYLAIQNNTKQSNSDKPLIPHFSTANYEHATALADPLPYFSTLHAIVKIVVNVVDKECGD